MSTTDCLLRCLCSTCVAVEPSRVEQNATTASTVQLACIGWGSATFVHGCCGCTFVANSVVSKEGIVPFAELWLLVCTVCLFHVPLLCSHFAQVCTCYILGLSTLFEHARMICSSNEGTRVREWHIMIFGRACLWLRTHGVFKHIRYNDITCCFAQTILHC